MTELAFQPWNSSNTEASSPRDTIVVAGEFEVGKSSIVNALLRRTLVPNDPGFVNRPLVRVLHSAQTIVHAELADGSVLEGSSVDEFVEREDVVVCTIFTPMPGMEAVEIIEVPFSPVDGFNADHLPVMRAANLFIWVTIASQAWRLSEKTVVKGLPDEMRERSVLAITRADKLRSEEDLDRIETRLQKEAAPFFNELVFVQASAKNLAASETDEAGWTATGGQALFEIASEIIGDLSADEEMIAQSVAPTNFGRRASDRVGVDLDHSEMEKIERELDNRFKTVAELPRELPSVNSVAESSVSSAATKVAPSFDEELEYSLNEILEEFESEQEDSAPTVAVEPSEQAEPVETFETPIETVTEEAVESVPEVVVPVAETPEQISEPEPEPEPLSNAEKISRAVDNVDGLVAAGVGDLTTLEIQASFKESTVTANQCLAAFSGMLEGDSQAMRQLKADDEIQEVIVAAENSLILLQRLPENASEIAFFVIQSSKTNPGISSMQTKRLLSVWQECREDG